MFPRPTDMSGEMHQSLSTSINEDNLATYVKPVPTPYNNHGGELQYCCQGHQRRCLLLPGFDGSDGVRGEPAENSGE